LILLHYFRGVLHFLYLFDDEKYSRRIIMKKLFGILFLFVALIAAVIFSKNDTEAVKIALTQANDIVAKVYYLKGTAYTTRTGDGKVLLKKSDLLLASDEIETEAGSVLILQFGKALSSRMKVGENSSLSMEFLGGQSQADKAEGNARKGFVSAIRSLLGDNSGINNKPGLITQLRMMMGNIVVQFDGSSKDQNLMLQTRSAAMGIRGTLFFVHASKAQDTILVVKEGEVAARFKDEKEMNGFKAGNSYLVNRQGRTATMDNKEWLDGPNWNLDPNSGELEHSAVMIRELDQKLRQNVSIFDESMKDELTSLSMRQKDLMQAKKSYEVAFENKMSENERKIREYTQDISCLRGTVDCKVRSWKVLMENGWPLAKGGNINPSVRSAQADFLEKEIDKVKAERAEWEKNMKAQSLSLYELNGKIAELEKALEEQKRVLNQ